MAKKSDLRCGMCGKFDSAESPVVPVIQDLCLCTDCIQFIDD